MNPDGINAGMTRELGWEKNAVSEGAREFVFDVATLGGLVETMVKRLNAHSMRVVGDAKMPVKRVVANWGYASLMPSVIKTAARPDVDVVICGETREWELVEYVQDQIAAGAKKALIVVNHVVSEQSGMRYCAEWLKSMVPEVPVEFMASKEPSGWRRARLGTWTRPPSMSIRFNFPPAKKPIEWLVRGRSVTPVEILRGFWPKASATRLQCSG